MAERRSMWRWARRYVLLLLVAVVASQLGAIALALKPPMPNWWIASGTEFPNPPAIVRERALDHGWNESATKSIGQTAVASRIGLRRVWMPGFVSDDEWEERVNGGLISELDWIATGFPFLSAIDARLLLHDPDRYMNPLPVPWTDGTTQIQLCGLGEPQERGLRIPIRPMFAGALANVAVYVVAIELIHLIWRRVRRWNRQRRSRCITCGYVIRSLDTCPECGSDSNSEGNEVSK